MHCSNWHCWSTAHDVNEKKTHTERKRVLEKEAAIAYKAYTPNQWANDSSKWIVGADKETERDWIKANQLNKQMDRELNKIKIKIKRNGKIREGES